MPRFFKGIQNKFIITYFLFGLIPLLIISYHSYQSASSSLERLSSRQISNLTQQAGTQVRQQYRQVQKDLNLLSGYPFIQLAFLQFSFGQKLEAVRLKLLSYKSQSNLYTRISLVDLDGNLILTVPEGEEPAEIARRIDKGRVQKAITQDFYCSGVLNDHPEGPLIIFSKRVYDFENPSDPVGLLAFYVRLEALTDFVTDLEPMPEARGFVFDHGLGATLGRQGLPLTPARILSEAGPAGGVVMTEVGGYQLFTTGIPELSWTAGLVLPEKELFGDILRLRAKSISFALVVAALAFTTTLFFVRRITDPIARLILGAKEFSEGNLDHRIEIRGEGELRRLGKEFNAMAEKIKAREKHIREVDRLASLGILAAGVAHEVRNPLAGMKSCVQLMQRKAVSGEVAVLAQGVDEEIDRLDKLVKNLLHFAKPGEPTPTWVKLELVLERALDMTGKSLQTGGVEIERDFAPVPQVRVDAGQTYQIFLNLILNAAQAMKGGGKLRVALRREDGKVITTIADTGCGIPREHIDRIFDPFFTLNPGGTGLGLSVAHSLMKENGISWEIDSAAGKGTTFELCFPLPAEQERT